MRLELKISFKEKSYHNSIIIIIYVIIFIFQLIGCCCNGTSQNRIISRPTTTNETLKGDKHNIKFTTTTTTTNLANRTITEQQQQQQKQRHHRKDSTATDAAADIGTDVGVGVGGVQRKCNGLVNLCTRRVNEVMFAAGHNGNAAVDYGHLALPNHYKTIEESIHAGYRGIQVDIAKCPQSIRNRKRKNKKNKLSLIHGSCIWKQSNPIEIFTNINKFLNDNPNEVLMIVMEVDYQNNVQFTQKDINDNVFALIPGFQQRMYSHPDRLNPFTVNPTEWPTLGELIDIDQRIIVFTYYTAMDCYTDPTNCPNGFHDWFNYAAETQFDMDQIDDMNNINYSCEVTRGVLGRHDFFAINNFLSIPRPIITETVLNNKQQLQQRINDCSTINNKTIANFVLVDFWSSGNVIDVVYEYNSNLPSTIPDTTTSTKSIVRVGKNDF